MSILVFQMGGGTAANITKHNARVDQVGYVIGLMTIALHSLPAPPQPNDELPAPIADQAFLEMLALRRSIKVAHLAEPGPDDDTLNAILEIGARVPDHGRLGPWRFIILAGEDRFAYGKLVAGLLHHRYPGLDEASLRMEADRFARAPVVVAVISNTDPGAKIPEWEQILSAGAVCYNVTLAARGFGFGSVWLSEWSAYDRDALRLLGLSDSERLAGFIYIGTPTQAPIERPRPDARTRISTWSAPA
jgi:nitroreductase